MIFIQKIKTHVSLKYSLVIKNVNSGDRMSEFCILVQL